MIGSCTRILYFAAACVDRRCVRVETPPPILRVRIARRHGARPIHKAIEQRLSRQAPPPRPASFSPSRADSILRYGGVENDPSWNWNEKMTRAEPKSTRPAGDKERRRSLRPTDRCLFSASMDGLVRSHRSRSRHAPEESRAGCACFLHSSRGPPPPAAARHRQPCAQRTFLQFRERHCQQQHRQGP